MISYHGVMLLTYLNFYEINESNIITEWCSVPCICLPTRCTNFMEEILDDNTKTYFQATKRVFIIFPFLQFLPYIIWYQIRIDPKFELPFFRIRGTDKSCVFGWTFELKRDL
eukprot:UN31760